ncbi:vWA domain-containing protein [Nonomuraea sp. PA05]|uniref:vWA domain-containing protein n=1 Tax=Nonomuraea sp. PA05 TaxID=2604466 RepID=UPI001651D48C|nr:VWA domain-containing protein [Nonomuraea sp. PA05]
MITRDLAEFITAWCGMDQDPDETTRMLHGKARPYYLSWLPRDLEAAVRNGDMTAEAMERLTGYVFAGQEDVHQWIREKWLLWFDTPAPFEEGTSEMDDERVLESTRVEEGQIVMPFYIICDVSGSMSGDMETLNTNLGQLHRAIVNQPTVDDVVQLSIISFSSTARVLMPLGQLSESALPRLQPEGATNYSAAFQTLAQAIATDREELKRQGHRIFRPCAFFLSDGAPTDPDWEQTFHQTLTYDKRTGQGNKAHPIFVPFGYRSAPESVLKKLAYPPEKAKWYLARNTGVEAALQGIIGVIMHTVISSGMSVSGGRPALVQAAPAPGSGISQGDSEYTDSWI